MVQVFSFIFISKECGISSVKIINECTMFQRYVDEVYRSSDLIMCTSSRSNRPFKQELCEYKEFW